MAAWDEFSEELRAKNLKGYWEVYQGEDYREPHSSFEPHLWKWEDIYPAILKAGELVDFEASVRRVLMLRNPSLKVSPPAYCYKWKDSERMLQTVGEQPGDPYDGILLQYVNPLTGGPTLPTLSCGIQMLRPGEKTKSHRHTSTALYHVFKGATTIDGARYEWGPGDSFVVPLWRFHHHENVNDREAILFVMTDKPLMDALGLHREE